MKLTIDLSERERQLIVACLGIQRTEKDMQKYKLESKEKLNEREKQLICDNEYISNELTQLMKKFEGKN